MMGGGNDGGSSDEEEEEDGEHGMDSADERSKVTFVLCMSFSVMLGHPPHECGEGWVLRRTFVVFPPGFSLCCCLRYMLTIREKTRMSVRQNACFQVINNVCT